ncbi:hypothetical protein FGO68_gene6228 [Halteria grandinella]|uniref:Uncharacterized protein n=1 Tax=Halteria grandinella TaxID=5974 RepID=A0A8J8NJA6_HALGN|nr:hypothetical protein FGO68_gene6228 [Halteria grandinella]
MASLDPASPLKIAFFNLTLSSKHYLLTHLPQLSLLSSLLLSPFLLKRYHLYRHSLFTRITSRTQLQSLLSSTEQHGIANDLHLRMRVIGFDRVTGEYQCMHSPLFVKEQAAREQRVKQDDGGQEESERVIRVRYTGVEYPMEERAVRELQREVMIKQKGIVMVTMNATENKMLRINQESSNYFLGWTNMIQFQLARLHSPYQRLHKPRP